MLMAEEESGQGGKLEVGYLGGNVWRMALSRRPKRDCLMRARPVSGRDRLRPPSIQAFRGVPQIQLIPPQNLLSAVDTSLAWRYDPAAKVRVCVLEAGLTCRQPESHEQKTGRFLGRKCNIGKWSRHKGQDQVTWNVNYLVHG